MYHDTIHQLVSPETILSYDDRQAMDDDDDDIFEDYCGENEDDLF